ncbi:unnamed protein product [Brassica napus]|uniref:(rape) hypothetical protein n=1 Tax=Brassica napus TaxID=3708 RepID=A0A816UG55_BRANA|nr:unnamed protein product [Brassica napus]
MFFILFYLMIGTERIGLDAGDSLGALGLNLESTGPGVFDALFSSFSMILVTEGLSIDHSLRARETTKTSAFVAGLEY